ncbi:sodium-dependent lysophosphatidylcholine symporter 1 [Oryzias melastigma]|uniref:sodium-dependent lysophosphatidylcholine symporter 1 n=1 Tax=Oryzias melastigma TaxID=30732 RepID=UPI000CF7C604|nr:sodium-dependent lysophosphatidylcholine symporter 1 [Oryzias melastigma]
MSCFQKFTHQLQQLRSCWSEESFTEDQQGKQGGFPLVRKVFYAVGGIPYQMTTAALNISLQIFLLDVVQMKAFYVSLILFVSRAWDAVTDPLVGYLVSRSKWTPIGKLTPWLLLSTPFGVLSYVLVWSVPAGSMSEAGGVLWLLVTTCLFETFMSCYNVPYLSLSMFLGAPKKDRDSATAYRMSVEMMAMLLASAIQGQVVSVYNTERQKACQLHEAAESTSVPQSASLQETQKAFLTSAVVMGAVFLLCSLVLFFGVKEQRDPFCSEDTMRLSYLTSVKMLARHVPYQRLVLGFVFSVSAFQMSLGNFALFCSHAAGLGAQFQLLLLVLLLSASVAVPLWQVVLLRIGKKATLFIGLSLFIPAVIIVASIPGNLPVFMTMCVLMGFSVATMFLLPWSMLPDVVDDFTSKHPSCKDLEPVFFSGYAFCSKLSGGLSAGLSTMTLQIAGYKAEACNHGDGVLTALIVLFSPVPITLLLIGMVIFHTYPINEKRRVQTDEEQLHPELSSSNSREDSEPPTTFPQSHVSFISTSHSGPAFTNICQAASSADCQKPSSSSTALNSPAGGSCRSASNVESKVSPQWHKSKPSGGTQRGRNQDNARSLSGRSHVRAKVSWV